MNRTVKLYCSVKRPSGDWGTKPVPDKQLMNLKDLPEGQGHYYLAYYEGKHRQMPLPPVCFGLLLGGTLR